MDVIDRDNITRDEFVESFTVNILKSPAAGSGMNEIFFSNGLFSFASITLSAEIECLPGFVGETCVPICSTGPCSNNGTCLPSGAGGFTCVCSGDYTGDTCQNRIDHCQGVDCNNNGTCVDGDQSFTCLCQQRFTGQLCDIIIDPAIPGNSTLMIPDNASGINHNTLYTALGTTFGGILVLVILAASCFFVAFLRKKNGKHSECSN